jgi:hypothetical protein
VVAPVVPKVARPSPGTAPSSEVTLYNGKKTPAASQSQEIQNRLLGLTGKRARLYIQQTGPTVDDIVEIHPDDKARRAGQRWFMIVKKAKMITVEGKECIESCRWCQTNTLQPCTIWKEGTHCRLENVRAYGVRDAPIFKDLVTVQTAVPRTVVLAKVAQLNQLVTAAKDVESSSSDSDAPISSGAKRLAREMAAAAAAAKKPKVTQQQVLAAVQRISARTKPQVSEECDGGAYCCCSKCAGY